MKTGYSLLHRLLRQKDGNIASMLGVAVIPLVLSAGVATDMAQAYAVKVRLGAALDSAALAVGSSDPSKLNSTQLDARLQNFVNANYPGSSLGVHTTATMSYDPSNSNIINFNVSATVPTRFIRIVGINNLTVSVQNQVTRGIAGLELALVLDNTGSMQCGDDASNCAAGVPPSHITSLKNDATDIVNIMFANTTDLTKLKIAVVPYVTAVNVGPAMNSSGILNTYVPQVSGAYKYLDGTSIQYTNWNNATNSNVTTNAVFDSTQSGTSLDWRGCVIEPVAGGYDVNEPGGGWTAPWNAYYWKSGNNSSFIGMQSSPATTAAKINTWSYTTGGHTVSGPPQYVMQDGNTTYGDKNSYGPNLGCPTPLVRLTNDQTTLTAATSNMTAWPNSGTAIHVGMIWGWRAVSPNAPFGDGLPYHTPNWIKAVVLETDGVNNINPTTGGANQLSGMFTGLGFATDGRMGSPAPTTQAAALTYLDGRLATVCANMKTAGIVIYTIGLGSGATNTTLQHCAGNGGAFFAAPTAADLQTAFQQIANSLNNLRLSK